jgi:hypothetical protein
MQLWITPSTGMWSQPADLPALRGNRAGLPPLGTIPTGMGVGESCAVGTQSEATRQSLRVSRPGTAHRTSCVACSTRSSSGCGKTPSPMVTAAQIVITALLQMLGTATCSPSSGASVKNISTITRT